MRWCGACAHGRAGPGDVTHRVQGVPDAPAAARAVPRAAGGGGGGGGGGEQHAARAAAHLAHGGGVQRGGRRPAAPAVGRPKRARAETGETPLPRCRCSAHSAPGAPTLLGATHQPAFGRRARTSRARARRRTSPAARSAGAPTATRPTRPAARRPAPRRRSPPTGSSAQSPWPRRRRRARSRRQTRCVRKPQPRSDQGAALRRLCATWRSTDASSRAGLWRLARAGAQQQQRERDTCGAEIRGRRGVAAGPRALGEHRAVVGACSLRRDEGHHKPPGSLAPPATCSSQGK